MFISVYAIDCEHYVHISYCIESRLFMTFIIIIIYTLIEREIERQRRSKREREGDREKERIGPQ